MVQFNHCSKFVRYPTCNHGNGKEHSCSKLEVASTWWSSQNYLSMYLSVYLEYTAGLTNVAQERKEEERRQKASRKEAHKELQMMEEEEVEVNTENGQFIYWETFCTKNRRTMMKTSLYQDWQVNKHYRCYADCLVTNTTRELLQSVYTGFTRPRLDDEEIPWDNMCYVFTWAHQRWSLSLRGEGSSSSCLTPAHQTARWRCGGGERPEGRT